MQGLSMNYILQMNFKSRRSFPLLNKIPEFYQNVLLCFNKVKYIKPFNSMSDHELLEQPLFGNELLQNNHVCIYFKSWTQCNILYVKDIINDDGVILSNDELYDKIVDKRNLIMELFTVKRLLTKHLKHCNYTF